LQNGNHSTLNRKHVNWNANLIWKMRMETEFAWELVLDEVHVVFERLKSTVTASLEYIKTKALGMLAFCRFINYFHASWIVLTDLLYIDSPCTSSLTAVAAAIDILIPSWAYKLGLEECAFHRGVR
jgi:hypothetical protein